MVATDTLPSPTLDARRFGARRVPLLTDDALFSSTGVRIAFTGRAGGVSSAPWDSLNLGGHVGDDPSAVLENRRILLEAIGVPEGGLVVPNQVHGKRIVCVEGNDPVSVDTARASAEAGADGLVVTVPDVAPLLCFADCVPVVIVSPTGCFAVVHAGWRGAVAGIAGEAVRRMAAFDVEALGERASATYNAYLGPHIHAECFETGEDVRADFIARFGPETAPDKHHVDLTVAVGYDLARAGLRGDRVVDAGVCTVCEQGRFFSYRASDGACGRHGAFAVRFGR